MPVDDPKEETPSIPPDQQEPEADDVRRPAPGILPTQHMAHLRTSALGSGLLAQQPTPEPEEAVAVPKVCPQCGAEYETGSRFCLNDGSALRPKTGADPMIGRVIAERYLVLARLGEGGMGRVYLAEHVRMNRQCAVKVMNPSLLNDTESSARFAREASSAARIIHPNVAAVFDFGESDKIVYIVMEFVDGEPLSRLLAAEGALDPRRAIDIGRQIADGLAAAHEIGIVHRDLKPDNIIVSRGRGGRETPKIVDFGIAKALSEGAYEGLTQSGLVIGTPEYMSPEQLLGDPVDARADVYSLGCILFYMVTGTPAFGAESREQMIRRRLREAPPHIRDVNPNLPRRLDTVIAHMLARSPSERMASAAEARDALDPALALAEWSPADSTVLRPTPRSLPTQSIPKVVDDIALQPTLPITQQRVSVRRVGVGAVIGALLLFAGIEAWQLQVERAAKRVAAPPARSVAARPTPPTSITGQSAGQVSVPPKTKAAPRESAFNDTTVIGAKQESATSTRATALHAPLDHFTTALATGDLAAVQKAYDLPVQQQNFWRSFFQDAEHVSASATYGSTSQRGDRATLSYAVRVKVTYKGGKSPQDLTFRYKATLERQNGIWRIAELQLR
ncbi:MAG TPA: serine/threonine-protein kinase [Gemmatimonadaceae bacterium]